MSGGGARRQLTLTVDACFIFQPDRYRDHGGLGLRHSRFLGSENLVPGSRGRGRRSRRGSRSGRWRQRRGCGWNRTGDTAGDSAAAVSSGDAVSSAGNGDGVAVAAAKGRPTVCPGKGWSLTVGSPHAMRPSSSARLVDIIRFVSAFACTINGTPVGVNPKPQRFPRKAGGAQPYPPTSGSSLLGWTQGLSSAGTNNTLAGSELPTRLARWQSRFG